MRAGSLRSVLLCACYGLECASDSKPSLLLPTFYSTDENCCCDSDARVKKPIVVLIKLNADFTDERVEVLVEAQKGVSLYFPKKGLWDEAS